MNTCLGEQEEWCKPDNEAKSGLYSVGQKDRNYRDKWEGTSLIKKK